MTSNKEKIARQQQAGRHTGVSSLREQNLHTSRQFAFRSNFNCNVHQYSLDRNISAESFLFLLGILIGKDCIEEITRFVAAIKQFSVGNKFIEHDSAARPLCISSCHGSCQK